jgi:hypothetical protein
MHECSFSVHHFDRPYRPNAARLAEVTNPRSCRDPWTNPKPALPQIDDTSLSAFLVRPVNRAMSCPGWR